MQTLIVRNQLQEDGRTQRYAEVLERMQGFTRGRDKSDIDELWLLEHAPVYTLGQASDIQHILPSATIPVVKTDRGGQVTYHGPGQIMIYYLADIARLKLSVRSCVVALENVVINVLDKCGVHAAGDREAPGVYVANKKVASIGLRISRGKSYHGVCLNYDASLEPFSHINPCGYPDLQVTQMVECCASLPTRGELVELIASAFAHEFGYQIEKPTKI